MGGACTKRPSVREHDNKDEILKMNIQEQTNSPVLNEENKIKETSALAGNIFFGSNVDFNTEGHTPIDLNSRLSNPNMKLSMQHLEANRYTTPQYYNISQNLEFIKGECIGIGKLGSVFSGLSINSGEIVAIKSVKLNKSNSTQKQIYEVNEAVEKLSQLTHKNIIQYICTQPSEVEDELDIIFEFCNGGSIKQLLEKFGSFDEKLIRLYVKQILEGLVYLHEQSIVHRNIKNCNVLVDGNGTVKLSDFVVSNILIGEDPQAILYFNTNNGKDPPFWMAPEIINKEKSLTWAVDIWSLGCIIIEMATKNPPWSNITNNCKEVMELIGNSNAPPKFPSHVSKELKSFLTLCLQKTPSKRPSARKLLEHSFFKTNLILKNNNAIQTPSGRRNSKLESPIKNLTEFKNKIVDPPKFLKKSSRSFTEKMFDHDYDYELINKKEDLDLKYKETQGFALTSTISKHTGQENKLLSNKLLKNKNFHIVEKQKQDKEKEEFDNGDFKNMNVVNILAQNQNEGTLGGAFFSLSMTVYSQQSIIPQVIDFMNNKDNKILPQNITEVEEDVSPEIKRVDKREFDDNQLRRINSEINLEEVEKSNLDKSYLSIKGLLENYNINSDFDLNDINNLEKLATLELKREDMQKLECFFKEKNNKMSIGPIEMDKVEHLVKELKN